MRLSFRRVLTALAPLLAAACAGSSGSAPATGAAPEPMSRSAASPNVITRAELEDPALGDVDMLSAVKRLRPKFLNFRGSPSATTPDAGLVQLSVDGGRLQPLEGLSAFRTTEVLELRYLSATDAAQHFGAMARAGPVIMLRRK